MTIPTDQLAYFAAVRSDLKMFLCHSFDYLYPNAEFMDNWHIDAIVYQLEESIRGRMPRLIVNLPPRQLKSFIISVVLPAFLLGLDPTTKIICISYSDELAKKLSWDFRRIVESEWYQAIFPKVGRAKSAEGEFITDQGGSRFAVSVGGTLTGQGGDFIIIDDPIKPDEATSDKLRAANNEWFRSTLLSRLDDKARSVLILVMQRLHVNDLTGFLESGGGFRKLSLPAIAWQEESILVGPDTFHTRHIGDLLHPAREDRAVLDSLRDQLGPNNFSAQYQQRPETPEGNLFKLKYFTIRTSTAGIKQGGIYWVSIDSAASTAETADYSAIVFGYSTEACHLVVSVDHGRWDYEQLKAKSLQYLKRCPEVTFIVEAASSGISLIQYLRKEHIPCFNHTPKVDKVTRAALALPLFVEGRVHFLSQEGRNQWVQPCLNEFMSFPNGRYDDQVDAIVQAVSWAERRVNPGGRIILC